MIVALGVMAKRLAANRVRRRDSRVDAERYERIADFGLIVGELANRLCRIAKLTSLAKATCGNPLVALAEPGRHH
jgi:hypothetical protein